MTAAHQGAPTMTETRTPLAALPRIVMFHGVHDSGEYGNATCPHCGAQGRYVWTFSCEDGVQRGAMAGCLKLYPVSGLAKEAHKILDRQQSRARKGGKLASWDVAKLEAIEAAATGRMSVADAAEVVRRENARRSAWMADRYGARRY